MPPTQQMQMQMIHRLPAIRARVDDDPVTAVQLLPTRNLYSRSHQVAHQRSISRHRLRSRSDVLLRNDQQMLRSLRIDIGKGDAEFILIHTIRWNGAGDDLAEEAVGRRGRTQLCRHGRKYFGCSPGAQGL
jgi:hypothetical protein